MNCWLRTKNNYFEIRHNGYVLLFLVAVLFSFVIILEIIDFVEHSFKANWFMYIGLLVFCVLLSFPVLFTTLKIKVRKDEIMVVKTCSIRIKNNNWWDKKSYYYKTGYSWSKNQYCYTNKSICGYTKVLRRQQNEKLW